MSDLHKRLISLQPIKELERKSIKSRRRGFYTQEDIDHSERWGEEMAKFFSQFNQDG